VAVQDDYLESWVTPEEAEEAAGLIAAQGGEGRSLLAIHPFGSIFEKTWPMERFSEVAALLADRYNLLPVILGAKSDRADFERFRHLFPEGSCDLVGRCGIRTTIAVLKRATFFLGNDSGVMHLAASAGLPLVAIFGPTSPARFGPWGKEADVIYSSFPCSPCRQKYFTECDPAEGGRPACIASITVDRVFGACCALLDKARN
jgi:heptosyltransferase-2